MLTYLVRKMIQIAYCFSYVMGYNSKNLLVSTIEKKGCENMTANEVMFQIVCENAQMCYHSWQLTVNYFRHNPHRMYLQTIRYYAVVREYYDVIHELYMTFDDEEFGDYDIVGFDVRLHYWVKFMELWLNDAISNGYDNQNLDNSTFIRF